MHQTGIYKIQSIQNPKKIYIGSAVNIQSRWLRHIQQLRKGKHGNRHLQRHYDKYGESDLLFSVIKYCEPGQLLQLEQFHINLVQPAFNICTTAGSRMGIQSTPETRMRIKQSCLTRPPFQMASRLRNTNGS